MTASKITDVPTIPTLPDREELIRRLLSDQPLLADTPDHLLQIVNVLLKPLHIDIFSVQGLKRRQLTLVS